MENKKNYEYLDKIRNIAYQLEKEIVASTLGVITPYRSQIALIKKEIEALEIPALNEILVDTVE